MLYAYAPGSAKKPHALDSCRNKKSALPTRYLHGLSTVTAGHQEVTTNSCAAVDVRDSEVLTTVSHANLPMPKKREKVKGNTQSIRKCLLNCLIKSNSVSNILYLTTCTRLTIDIYNTP